MSGGDTPERHGRWPANVILDEVTAGLLDEQSGVSKSPKSVTRGSTRNKQVGSFNMAEQVVSGHDDKGGASRFFYVAKASKRDRNEGLEELLENDSMKWSGGNEGQGVGAFYPDGTPRPSQKSQNFHPTVKPTQLMRYLIKLVTPPGGTVLDPFTGSGSTGKAALLDDFEFVGAELTEDYLPIIEGRLKWAVENREEESLF
jgi:site-specific DNA-methyltransferase (adenine-specific)